MHVYKAWAHDVALSIYFTLSFPTAEVSDFSNNAIANQYVAYLAWSSGAVDDYAPGGVVNTVCRPLAQKEYDALPEDLKPLMRHLCPTEKDTLQQLALDKAEAAKKQAFSGFDLLNSHPEKVATANKHIEVKIRAD